MAENEKRPPASTSSQPSKSSAPPLPRPSITLPPRASFEALFNGGGGGGGAAGGPGSVGFSPGPMTLVSSFFSDADADADDCKSFSQLLAGAMASPAATSAAPSLPLLDKRAAGDGGVDDADFRFKQNRPSELAVAQSPMFVVGLPDSPGLFSPGQGEFGMSHQLALAQVTAEAAQTNSNTYIQTEYLSSLSAPLTELQAFATNATTQQEVPPLLIPDSSLAEKESSDISHQDPKSQPSSFNADKPNDDGYNWRKYGQKNVKGSEFPRSYYKCTHPNCPVKKKVERSLDGQVTEIIYRGQHNHQRPQSNKRGKDAGNSNGNSSTQGNHDLVSQIQSGYYNKSAEGTNSYSISRKDQESSQATHEHLSGTSDSDEVGDAEEKDEDEPEPKRRNTEVRHSEPASSHRTVTEPRIIVQTTSEVDLLDDGYRWRKYGQKVVKGNPYPRSYYKCTTPSCNVRKHVERASTDPKAVITTYEGKHNHDVPASKTSSHNTAANSSASNQRLQNTRAESHGLSIATDLRNNTRQPITRLRLKEEQIT